MQWVLDAKHIDAYKIWIKFNDGTEGIANLSSTIHDDHREVFQMLKDEDRFKRFKVEADTIVWENGLDLAPEYLFDLVHEKSG